MPLTFDQYNYCSLGCLYCFAYFFKSNNPAIREITLKSVNVDKMIANMQGRGTKGGLGRVMYRLFYENKFLLHWGGLADPFCQFEAANRDGLKLIDALGEMDYPCLFSFKGGTVFKKQYLRTFERYADQQNFAFQVSIITGDDEKAKLVEIGVPSPSKRIEAIRRLSAMGYWTILRLRPYIIGISEHGIESLLERSLEAGIRAVSMEFFAMDMRCNTGMRERYEWIAKLVGVDDLQSYFKRLSPSERGGYMRLNRLVKEQHVRTVYEFCVENDLVFACSDPDFKELNMSGSCCGMPDDFPNNRGVENWTRHQLTFHLKECRRKYHETGEPQYLTFNEVYPDDVPYLNEGTRAYMNLAVGLSSRCEADRANLTFRLLLQEQWNNLRSPANPRNYFHGKLLPVGLDNDGNLRFRYAPSEYEERWLDEGIVLSSR